MKKFQDLNLLVIGDIILDEYVNGTVTRISPEAPIPILDKKETYFRLGGASNVSKNIVSLGICATQVGQVGFDWHGDLVKKLLSESGVVTKNVKQVSGRPTIVKTRFTCGNVQLLRVDYEDKSSIKGSEMGRGLEDFLVKNIKHYDAVIISDYEKGMIYPELAELICREAKLRKIPVVIDTHKKNWDCFKNATCMTPNKKELEQAVGKKLETLQDVETAGMQIRRDLNLDYLLVTLSENGMLLLTQYAATHVPVEPMEVVDVTGCGDTAIAVFTVALAAGTAPLKSVKLANKAAGIVVGKMGTASVTSRELFD